MPLTSLNLGNLWLHITRSVISWSLIFLTMPLTSLNPGNLRVTSSWDYLFSDLLESHLSHCTCTSSFYMYLLGIACTWEYRYLNFDLFPDTIGVLYLCCNSEEVYILHSWGKQCSVNPLTTDRWCYLVPCDFAVLSVGAIRLKIDHSLKKLLVNVVNRLVTKLFRISC